MSFTEGQLREMMDQADAMMYGPGHIALVEQIIAHADALQLNDLAYAARREALGAYRYLGEPTKALVMFAWCVAEFDRDPEAYADTYDELLWDFKFAVGALTRSPEVPLDRTYAVLDDMQRRWQETGHSPHAVYSHRHRVARHIGDLETAHRYYDLWCAAPRDDLSDCAGCDPEMKALWLKQQGRDEEAVAVAATVLSGQNTCSDQPQSMLTTLMVPYLRTGRLDEARDAHRRAYRLHRTHVADLAEIAEHIEFCARTGNEARALEMVERHIGWLDRAPSPWDAMVFAASSAMALRRAQALRPGDELTLLRPAHEAREATRHSAVELASQLEAQVTEISGRFDRRNGTDRVSTQMRAILTAEPLIDHLPLSPTSTRPGPNPLPSGTSAADSSTVVGLFEKESSPGSAIGGPPPAPVRQLDLDQAIELAQSDRATEAIDTLVEAVADRTAHGDEAGAADARHYLAIAYLNVDRPLDAAEVAEEALAYRVRADAQRDATDPASANEVHHLLAAIYQRLGQPDDAVTHLDAISADCARRDDHLGVARMNEAAGDILEAIDRDDEAAPRFHVAARAFARAGLPRDQVRNHRQRAMSATWAHGPEAGLAALTEARDSAALLPDEDASRGDRAFIDIDEAQIRWRMGELAQAADLARLAADAWQAIGELRSSSEARALLGRILNDDGRPAEAELVVRQALHDLPEPDRRPVFVAVLDAALRAQDRQTDADAVWAEFGLTRPDDEA